MSFLRLGPCKISHQKRLKIAHWSASEGILETWYLDPYPGGNGLDLLLHTFVDICLSCSRLAAGFSGLRLLLTLSTKLVFCPRLCQLLVSPLPASNSGGVPALHTQTTADPLPAHFSNARKRDDSPLAGPYHPAARLSATHHLAASDADPTGGGIGRLKRYH